jgi:hypothetical protein
VKPSGLQLWLARGRKISIGGRELLLMPLPLSRLADLGDWLEKNSNDVVQEAIAAMSTSDKVPNPLELITSVLLRIDTAAIAYEIFTAVKHPETGKSVNEDLTIQFFQDYLDVVVGKEVVLNFIEVNQLDDLIKNLSRLPTVKKLFEIVSTSIGLPYLNSLHQSMASTPSPSEGTHSPKSTDTLMGDTSAEQEGGAPKKPQPIM